MPNLSNIPPDKLAALMQIRAEGRSVLLGQITRFSWPTDTRYYAPAPYDRFPEFAGLPFSSIEVRLTASNSNTTGFEAYITDLSFNVDVEDSKINIDLSNGDGAIEDLYLTYGWGVPVEVFYYFPQVDLLVSRWFGYLDPVLSASNPIFKATASRSTSTASLSSRRRELPGAPFYPHCVADFPPEYPQLFPTTQSIIGNDCPFDAHLGGSNGIAGPTTCDRTSKACKVRFGDVLDLPYLGFDSIQQNNGLPFRQDSKTIDQTRGNSSNLSEPIRVVFGHRVVKDLDIVQVTIQVNPDHPERGSVQVTTIECEGPVSSISNIQINNLPVDPVNYHVRTGTVRQQPTTVIPLAPIFNYSSRALSTQYQKGDFRGAAASQFSVRATVEGLNNIRIYSDPTHFTPGYTTNPAWCGLEAFRNRRWGLGVDLSRLHIQDWIDLGNEDPANPGWFNQTVSTLDASGTQITSRRATFNAEWRGRKAQDQIRDFCLYRRITLPFPFEGKLRVLPLKAEILDQDVPVFTDRVFDKNTGEPLGNFRNILPGPEGISSCDYQETDIDEQVNELVAKFDDATLDDMAERPLLFADLPAQRAAGARAGDNTLMKIKKEHFLTGITDLAEAIRQGNILLDLGEFDEGGLVNPIRITFNCSLLDALTLHPYKVIQVDSYKLDRMVAKWGFTLFRILKMEQTGLIIKVTAQAYPKEYYDKLEDSTVKLSRAGGSPTGPNGGGGGGGAGGGPGGGGGPTYRAYPLIIQDPDPDPFGVIFKIGLGEVIGPCIY